MKKHIYFVAFSLFLTLSACSKKEETSVQNKIAVEEKVLNIYNWPDYIPKNTLANFKKETGISVNYRTFESNEIAFAKLMAGKSGYDIVVPSASFIQMLIKADKVQPLQPSKIPNYKNVDMNIMAKLHAVDPGNKYALPWGWGYTTVGIDVKAVKIALGDLPLPKNSWELVFNPKYTHKLKKCGIAYLDSAGEVIPPALHYIGSSAPYAGNSEDIQKATKMLAKVRPDIRYFSSTLVDDLASGKACAVLGWAGDINISRDRAIENNSGREIRALLPSTGALTFFDVMVIPKDAKNPNNARKFIDFLMRPKESAALVNELNYVNTNKNMRPYVDKVKANDETTFLNEQNLKKLVPNGSISNQTRELYNKMYTNFKSGR